MEDKEKVKAKELIFKFYDIEKNDGFFDYPLFLFSQKCALIAVDEILYTFNTNWQWCSVAMEDKAIWSKEFEFWKKVKEEISSYENKS